MKRAALVILLLMAGPTLAQEPHMHAGMPADADWYPKTKSPTGGSCCGFKDCRLSSYCSTDTVAEGVVVDGACIPIPYDRLVPAPVGIELAPEEVHICAQRRVNGDWAIICVVGGFGV